MKILEANFISTIPVSEFIMMETEKQRMQYKFSDFVAERSKSVTSRLMRDTNYQSKRSRSGTRQDSLDYFVRMDMPDILGRAKSTQVAARRREEQERVAVKTVRGLKYVDFLQVMRRQLYIPYKLSAIVFARLCKPKPNEKNPIVTRILDMQKEIDIGRDTNICQDSVI